MIDLFVNNETTYTYIHQSLFPMMEGVKIEKTIEKRSSSKKVADEGYFMTEVILDGEDSNKGDQSTMLIEGEDKTETRKVIIKKAGMKVSELSALRDSEGGASKAL